MYLSCPDERQNRKASGRAPALLMILFTLIVLIPLSAPAGETAGAPADQKIRITADNLNGEMNEGKSRWAEFIGNVKATQGDAVIEADKLRIHINETRDKSGGSAGENAAIEKIVAEGHVRITFGEIRAETGKAVYTIKDKVLVLTGADSTILNGPNRLTGSKITLHRANGRIHVQGKGSNRVKAVFFPTDGGLE